MFSLKSEKQSPTSVTLPQAEEEPLCWGILGLLGKVGTDQERSERFCLTW